MNTRHTLLNASALALLLAGFPAMAADEELLDAPEVTISAAQTPVEGFYLRADLGYAPWSHEGDPSLSVSTPAPAGLAATGFDDARFGKPPSGALGVGYQFSDMLRADFTADYFQNDFDGSGESTFACGGAAAGTTCGLSAKADYSAIGLMANAYVDLGTLAGFTPYVGAGAGSTRVSFDDASVTGACLGGACAGGASTTYDYQGESSWRFTYAIMAGVSYDVSERLKLDIGYRYSDIAGGDVFKGADARLQDDGLRRHEFRAGLRLAIW